jgi:hypothetical protein
MAFEARDAYGFNTCAATSHKMEAHGLVPRKACPTTSLKSNACLYVRVLRLSAGS